MTLLINAVVCLSLAPSLSLPVYPCPCFLSLCMWCCAFCFALLAMVGVCIQHLLGLGHQPMGQFSVLLALCHRVLLISTFFPPPLRPSREVVLVTSLIVNNSFQWEQTGCPLCAPLQVCQCRSGTFREAGYSVSSLLPCWRKSVRLYLWIVDDKKIATNKFVINFFIIIKCNVTVDCVPDWVIIMTVSL